MKVVYILLSLMFISCAHVDNSVFVADDDDNIYGVGRSDSFESAKSIAVSDLLSRLNASVESVLLHSEVGINGNASSKFRWDTKVKTSFKDISDIKVDSVHNGRLVTVRVALPKKSLLSQLENKINKDLRVASSYVNDCSLVDIKDRDNFLSAVNKIRSNELLFKMFGKLQPKVESSIGELYSTEKLNLGKREFNLIFKEEDGLSSNLILSKIKDGIKAELGSIVSIKSNARSYITVRIDNSSNRCIHVEIKDCKGEFERSFNVCLEKNLANSSDFDVQRLRALLYKEMMQK